MVVFIQKNPSHIFLQDQINRLENVLQSAEAKDVLGEVISANSAAAVAAASDDLNASFSDILADSHLDGVQLDTSLSSKRDDDADKMDYLDPAYVAFQVAAAGEEEQDPDTELEEV